MYDDWAVLEFPDVKTSILGKFSYDVSEPVANLLIRELVESVDRPGTVSGIKLDSEQELEWVMQVINYAFSLSFISSREFETIRAAIRIYLSWMTSITPDPHRCCPTSLVQHPDRYFKCMLEALRMIFLPRHIPYTVDANAIIDRQANEIRNVLGAIKLWTSKVKEDYKDEVWSRSLIFLMIVNEQLLATPSSPDDIGSVVAQDLAQNLLDSWIHAALHQYIPSPSYWKTLAMCTKRWIFQVPLIEIWARKLLSLTVLLIEKLHGNKETTKIVLNDIHSKDVKSLPVLKETWLRLFHLLGNPAQFLLYSNRLNDNAQIDTNLLTYINGQISLAFFVAVTSICKMIEIFYGNTQISIDFHENDDLYHIWIDACKIVQEEWNRSYNRQRPSNMSSGSSGVSGMNTLSTGLQAGDANTLTYQSLAASNTALAQGNPPITISRKNTAKFTESTGSNKGQKISAKNSQPLPQIPPEPVDLPRLRPGQYVWYYLKSNKITAPINYETNNSPKVSHMLEIFMYWLYDSALVSLSQAYKKYSEDVISQQSMSSAEIESQNGGLVGGGMAGLTSPTDSGVTRHSFAQSTTSSSDISSPQNSSHVPQNVFEYPSVDGVAAGRAAALGALCRIICAKSSREQLPDDQLAQFFTVMHEALIERDRLMLCSLLYYSVDLFKLGLKGVELLLPNYLMAIDIILTESMKLRLHPSIHEVEMRNACLRALASIISWPTTFGPTNINEEPSKLNHGSGNALESNPTYIEMRPRILRNLVHTLRNETDSANLHLALALCATFCEECCRYDLSMAKNFVLQEKKVQKIKISSMDGDSSPDEEEKYFAVSILRGIVSAICDNLCKSQWNSETITCLAALDCLNVIATLPQSIVFSNRDMSTGSLIVTSLCRFVDTQLQKPPPFHSRDLHSSVVAAYSSIQIWLCSAPMLTEIDACLTTVAQTIEFGLTGGKGPPLAEHKPASQRVYDAADLLLNTLFSIVGGNNPSSIIDERRLLYKYSPQNIDITKFRHFLVRQHTLISIHEATHIDEISHDYPTLFLITRTPYHAARTSIVQLRPKACELKEGQENLQISDVPSPGAMSLTLIGESLNAINAPLQKPSLRKALHSSDSKKSMDSPTGAQKQFEMPTGFDKPQCKLDAAFSPLQPTPETDKIITQLDQIKHRLSQGGGSLIGQRDAHNVWIQSSLGSFLSQPPRPQSSAKKCNAGRVFLYDLGLINEKSFSKEFSPLDSLQNDEFYRDLHQIVDRKETKILQTVGIFYVKDGQRTAGDILDNALAIQTTRPEFCRFLAELGEGVDISSHPNWTGHWATAFSAERKPLEKPPKQDNYALDGINHCLWWSDSLHEIAYVMFSERSTKLSHLLAGGNGVDRQGLTAYSRGGSREITVDDEDLSRRGYGSPVALLWRSPHVHPINLAKIHQNSPKTNKTFHRPDSNRPPPEHKNLEQKYANLLTLETGSSNSEEESSNYSTSSPQGDRRETIKFLRKDQDLKKFGYRNESFQDYLNFEKYPTKEIFQEKIKFFQNSCENSKKFVYRHEKLKNAYEITTPKSARFSTKNEFEAQEIGYYNENLPYEIEINPIDSKFGVSQHENLKLTQKTLRYSPSRNRQYVRCRVKRQSSVSPRFARRSIPESRTISTPPEMSENSNFLSEIDTRRLSEPGFIFEDRETQKNSRKIEDFTYNSSTLTRKFSESAIAFPQTIFNEMAYENTTKIQIQPASANPPNQKSPPPMGYSLAYFKSLFRKKSPEIKPKSLTGDIRKASSTEESSIFSRFLGQESPHMKIFSSKTSSIITQNSGTDQNTRASDVSQQSVPMGITSHKSRTSSLSSHSHPDKSNKNKRNPDQRIFVVWLERIEDMYHFPYDQFFHVSEDGSKHTSSKPDFVIFFLHNFEPGLIRVHIEGVWTKYGQPGPLVDGMVVSTTALSSLIRQTVISIARRKTIEVDQYQMVHLKRKLAIQELAKKYLQNISYRDFLDKFITP